jgi:hypothetical protein
MNGETTWATAITCSIVSVVCLKYGATISWLHSTLLVVAYRLARTRV